MNHIHAAKTGDSPPVSTVLAVIEDVMKRAEHITDIAADEHMRAFTMQMQEKVGVARLALDEPYLLAFLKQREVQFLESLEKLFDTVDRKSPPPATKNMVLDAPWVFEYKAIDYKEPLLPQVTERLDIEKIRYTRHLKQGLDARRQQAFGIKKYVWQTSGDDRVRPTHAAKEGQVFTWNEGEDPGEAPNCRCSAEPYIDGSEINDPPLDPVYPELLIPMVALRAAIVSILERVAAKRLAREAAERAAQTAKPKPAQEKPVEAPKPAETPKPQAVGKNPPPGGRSNTEWTLGKHKSPTKWENQMRQRGWTNEKITDTIKNGKEYEATNKPNPTNGATRYEKDGRSIVRDNKTNEILQVGGDGFGY